MRVNKSFRAILSVLILFSHIDVRAVQADVFAVNFFSVIPASPVVPAVQFSPVIPKTADLLSINYSDVTPDLTFTYDRLGRQKTVTDALGNRTFAYNAALAPLTETITGLYTKTLTRTYATTDVIGRLSGFNTGSDYATTYGYDTFGRLNSVGWTVGSVTSSATYGYLANSELIENLTSGSGRNTATTYEPNRNLAIQIKHQFNTTLRSQYDYLYDNIGRRTSVKNSGTAFSAAAFNKFQYNNRSELGESTRYLGTDINILTNPVLAETRGFTYDPIGNQKTITQGTNPGSYTANNLNQYSTANLPGGGFNTYTHDDDGNLTQLTGTKNVKYAYNAENRLVTVQPVTPALNNKKLDFIYDYQGRRIQKIVSNWNGSSWVAQTTKQYIFDGWNVVLEQTVSPADSQYYVWGLDLSQSLQGAGGVGGLLAFVNGSVTRHYLSDGNGNVGQLMNPSSGVVDGHYEYDPYGNQLVATGAQAAANPYRFSTKYLDAEYNLYYYGFRYYDPDIGRWLNRDPIEEEGGILLYGFSLNDPINNYDADGRAVETGWDAFNVGSGVISFGCNIASGNVIGALVDGIGLVYDATATAVPGLPGGAQTAIQIYRGGRLAPKMYRFLELNQTAKNVYRYGVRQGVDEAHHIIPRAGSPINWTDKTLRKELDIIRAKAKKIGFDIDGAANGVALPKDWHKNNTLGRDYYQRVADLFRKAETKEDFIMNTSDLAEQLLKESGKVK